MAEVFSSFWSGVEIFSFQRHFLMVVTTEKERSKQDLYQKTKLKEQQQQIGNPYRWDSMHKSISDLVLTHVLHNVKLY